MKEKRLQLQRQQLGEQLDLVKKAIEQEKDIQRRIGELALVCGQTLNTIWTELHAIRSSDLPNLEAFDSQLQSLDSAWTNLRHALENYHETSV